VTLLDFDADFEGRSQLTTALAVFVEIVGSRGSDTVASANFVQLIYKDIEAYSNSMSTSATQSCAS
jgi:hypothetical protein